MSATVEGILAAVCATLGVLLTGINGLTMLISPRRFFSLPRWLRAQGSLDPEHYSSGFGGLQLRILGAVLVAAVVWFLYRGFLWMILQL